MSIPFVENQPGVYLGLPPAVYHAAPGASKSKLNGYLRSALHAKLKADEEAEEDKETKQRTFGSMLHHILLEPTEKPFWCVVPDDAPKKPTKAQLNAPKPSPAAIASIAYWEKWNKENAGLIPVDSDFVQRVFDAVAAVMKHPFASIALTAARREVSVFVENRAFAGTLCKSRIDIVHDDPLLIDFKSTDDARLFLKQAAKMNYDMQGAFYLDNWNEANPDERKASFLFIAVEWKPPYGIMLYEFQGEALGGGREKYITALQTYVQAQRSGVYPCYPEEVKVVDWPLGKKNFRG